jgi:hypothetical protein
MQTDASLERDTDLIQEYVELLNRGAARPGPFGKLASLAKLGSLRRRLAAAARRSPSPELERAEAIAAAETTSTWGRRVATSFWGSRLLMAITLFVGQQFVLLAILVLSAAYTNIATYPPIPEHGYVPRATRAAIVLLIAFVFAFYAAAPVLAALLLWGGRFFRTWRLSVPVVLLLLLGSAVCTLLTFRGLANPGFASDSIHQFVETRSDLGSSPDVNPYISYQKWLDNESHWLLKDPKLKADYEQYLRNGPGRWLTNKFDTNDPGAWASPDALLAIGALVDTEFDQAKFRDWLVEYIDRNKINSRDIDRDVDALVAPANQRFLSVWQAEPFLRDRDVNVRRHYFDDVFRRMRLVGIALFGTLLTLSLIAYLVGPLSITAGWVARSLRAGRVATAASGVRTRYYAMPERADLGADVSGSTMSLLARVHRSYVRSVLAVTIVVLGAWILWLGGRSQPGRIMATQNALMNRFVAIPADTRTTPSPAVVAPAQTAPLAMAGPPAFPAGTGDPSVAVDRNGDGVPDERVRPTLESRLAAIEKQLEDSDYEFRKRFKSAATLLEVYSREIDALRAQNASLEARQADLLNSTSALGSRLSTVEGTARSAAAIASAAQNRAESIGVQVTSLADTVEERTAALDRRAGQLEKRDDEIQATVDAVSADLDEKTTELRARTERLGERATDLAERGEQIAALQRTVYAALVDEFARTLDSLERRSHSRLYRMFNKAEARAQLADLRRRVQLVRAKLQESDDPDAPAFDKQLAELQERIGPVEVRYR